MSGRAVSILPLGPRPPAEAHIAAGDPEPAFSGAADAMRMVEHYERDARHQRAMAAIAAQQGYKRAAKACEVEARWCDRQAEKHRTEAAQYLHDADWALGVKAGKRKAPEVPK